MATDPTAANQNVTVAEQLKQLAADAQDSDKHDVALDALRAVSQRPGVKTTEFYLSIVLNVVGMALIANGKMTEGTIMSTVATVAYTLSRGMVKKAAVAVALFLALTLSACTPAGYVKAEAIEPLYLRVKARHDDYVRTDYTLSRDQQETYLRSSDEVAMIISRAESAQKEAGK